MIRNRISGKQKKIINFQSSIFNQFSIINFLIKPLFLNLKSKIKNQKSKR